MLLTLHLLARFGDLAEILGLLPYAKWYYNKMIVAPYPHGMVAKSSSNIFKVFAINPMLWLG
jgi:hypothetical protein